MKALWNGWEPARLDILPLPTFVQYFLLVLGCPSPLSAPPQHFTRVRGWPHASLRKGRLIPLGQGSCLPLCIQPPAPPQPWTGLPLPCCSLCFSSRPMEFAAHPSSQEVSGEFSGRVRGASPLPPCHHPAWGLGRRWRKNKYPTSVREAKDLSQIFSQSSKTWRCVCFCPLHHLEKQRKVCMESQQRRHQVSPSLQGCSILGAHCFWLEEAQAGEGLPPPSKTASALHSSAEGWFCLELEEELPNTPSSG